MAYNEALANRIRDQLADIPNIVEKEMMGGLTFMVNDKMCIGIIKDDMMCRIAPEMQDTVIEKTGCRIMDFTGRPMKGYVMVDDSIMKTKKKLKFVQNLLSGLFRINKTSLEIIKNPTPDAYIHFLWRHFLHKEFQTACGGVGG